MDNIRAEFPLLEANVPSYSFLSIDYIIPRCTTSLYHYDRVTDTELVKIISGMNKTTFSSDPFPIRLLMSQVHAMSYVWFSAISSMACAPCLKAFTSAYYVQCLPVATADCCLPTPMTLASGGGGLVGGGSPPCGPPASFSVHLASSAVTPAGSVHKSRDDNVVSMWVQLKRWCVSCVWVLQRGHGVYGCDLASTLCKYDLRKGDLLKYLFRADNVWWRCAQYFVIASCG